MIRQSIAAVAGLLLLALAACSSSPDRPEPQPVGSMSPQYPAQTQAHYPPQPQPPAQPAYSSPGVTTNGAPQDNGDQKRLLAAEQRAYTAPVGQRITWNNPSDDDSGTITPVKDSYAANGAYCRDFQQTIVIGGQEQQAYGRACQQPDGSWKIVQ